MKPEIGCEWGSDKKNLMAVKGPQVAVVLLGVAVKVCRDLATLSLVVDCEVKKYPEAEPSDK